MSTARVPIHGPAPAPDGPIACTLHPNDYAGRLDDFHQGLFTHLAGMERPEPTRLRLAWPARPTRRRCGSCWSASRDAAPSSASPSPPATGSWWPDLEVPAEAAPALDGLVRLAELSAPGVAR